MAISKIKKIEIIGLERDKEPLLTELRRLGVMQLIEVQAKGQSSAAQTAHLEVSLSEIEEEISFLSSFREQAGGFGGIVKFKPLIFEERQQELIATFDYKALLAELAHLRNHYKGITQHRERLIQEKHLLSPWSHLKLSLEEIYYKQHCGVILGILNTRDFENFCGQIEEKKINTFVEVVEQDKANTYLTILYIRDDFELLEALLKNTHFNFVTLPRHNCTVKERIFEINGEILFVEDRLAGMKEKLSGLSEEQLNLMVMYDYLNNIRKTQEADRNLEKQQFTFLLKGWIRQKDQKSLEDVISAKFKDAAVFVSSPKEGEEVPVVLENKSLIQPFEFITSIYGMPKYNELDPTPFLAPFFFIYFGFCVSDAGYGFMLVLMCWFMLKKFRLGPQGKKFFKLFLFCGISTIIIGILTGSWFGNLPDILAENSKAFIPLKKMKDAMVVLDPLQEPTKLLGIALTFGIVQVWFGIIVAAIGNIKNKRYLDIVFDQVTMLIFLFGLTGLGLIFLKLLDAKNQAIFQYASLVGAIGLTLTQGRSEKGIGAKLFYGIYNLYNSLSGYLSDILSYSRLWALGLVTGVMAATINMISIQFAQIFVSLIPVLNKIVIIKLLLSGIIIAVIFVLGHIVSFFMNLLGAFVHPVRLQFVEFFSKFFKSGGRTFKPFEIESKYINIEQKGGS